MLGNQPERKRYIYYLLNLAVIDGDVLQVEQGGVAAGTGAEPTARRT